MQIFAKSERRFYSFMEFNVIHPKIKGEKFDHSTTLRFCSSPLSSYNDKLNAI